MTATGQTDAWRAAEMLWQRWQNRTPGGALPAEIRPVTVAGAWAVQQAFTELAGPRIGWKIAASSPAGQAHIGVPGPIAGPLLAGGLRASGAGVPLTSMASAEPEIAFRLGTDLPARERPYDRETVLAAVADVLPAIDIPDSRYADVPAAGEAQLVADLACTAYVVLGEPIRQWSPGELKDRRVVLRINGEIVSEGSGADALGDPCAALVWLVDAVTRHGCGLRAGEVVITGAAAPPRPVKAGDVVTGEVAGAAPVTATIS
ncbi:2-keto-4-pentenoate hydratase [Amycolatopsis pithecellobii]|uniref:Hydratase n=1 Tax=Amycolatopsis pithecellobii TaxID=664692 RepID=A0A6N7Z329_9PSEU|nr:fumarylacetoacetate hydrolase family protein [Amycolatopsis pithecellobii]MTD54354.1 hydratase [Amycolatopsis pithecellobii]